MEKRFLLIKMTYLLAIILIGSGYIYGQDCPDGMISYWKMQEISGPSYVDSYGSHNAIASNSSPSVTQGISGNAQLFSKTGSTYITVSDHADFDWGGNSSFSIELWVKFSGTSTQNQVFIGRDESANMMQWWIGANVSGKINWYVGSSDGSNGLITTDASFNNGSWHHVVAVRDGTYSKNYLYIDGVLQNTGGTVVNLTGNLSSSAPISMGNLIYSGTPSYYYSGALDEVAIYNRALDLNLDILPHYNNLRLYQIGYCDGDDPQIFSNPVIEARVGQLYTYNVDASGNSVPTYSLIQGPEGMTINNTTGMITWTPTSVSQNGHVVVRATNDKGYVEQDFNIFIADAPDCRDNLVAYWDFDDSAVPPFFDNISNYKLSGVGPISVEGVAGKGLLFDGVNDSLNMQDTFESGKAFFDFDEIPNFTIEVWAKTNASKEKTMVLVGREVTTNNTQYWLGINPDGTVGFYLRDWRDPVVDAYIEGGSNLQDGNWHHIVGSYDKGTKAMKLYVDGLLGSSTTQSFYNFGGGSDLNIGMLNTSLDKYWFEGVMDELAFYNVQLTDARVLENYNTGLAGNGACVYNHAPVIVSTPDIIIDQGANYYYKLISTDIDKDDVISISAITKPEWLSFTFTPGDTVADLSGIPGNSDVGLHNITLRVTDGSINVDQAFVLEVINVNDPPVITSTPVLEIDQGAEYSYTMVAEDPDGDELTYSAPQIPASFNFNTETHVLSGVPTNDDVGTVDIILRVSDGTVEVDHQFQITVNNVNDPPEITSTPVTEIFQDEQYSYTIVAVDPDGDELIYSAPQIPAWMTFDVNNHKLTGITSDFEGVVDITLRVSDGLEDVDQSYQLTVKNVNDLPVITSDPITEVHVNESYLYTITATDEDGDVLTYTAEDKPDWLTFTPASNSAILSGTPQSADKGSHPVIIKVSDGIGEVIQAFSITVKDPVGVNNNNEIVDCVYPVPANDIVHFIFAEQGNITLWMYDITGAVLKIVTAENTDQLHINVSDFNGNLFFYKASVGDRYTVGKIMKN